jgi:hypothetical protein
MQLFQPLRADRLDAQRHFLQVFRALLRRDDDALQNAFTVGSRPPGGWLQRRGNCAASDTPAIFRWVRCESA